MNFVRVVREAGLLAVRNVRNYNSISLPQSRNLSQYRPVDNHIGANFRSVWNVSCYESKVVTSTSVPVFEQKRYMARQKKLRRPPTKPLSFDTGDQQLTPLIPYAPTDPKAEYEGLPQLADSSPVVKKLVSMEFADGQAHLNKELDSVMKLIQDHPADVQSLEVKIAKATVHIRNLIPHCLKFRKDKRSKVRLLEAFQLRRKNLKILRRYDIDKFNWIQEVLGVKYAPVPQYNRKLSKRAMRKKLAREACWAVIDEKMKLFRAKLEEEKKEFDMFKNKELHDISTQLGEMGLELKPTIKETILSMGVGQDLFKEERRVKRRQAILQKKFELYGIKSRDRGSQPRIKFFK